MPVTGARPSERLLGGGPAGLVTGARTPEGAGVIDGGINRVAGDLVGDGACEPAAAVPAAITRVPGISISVAVRRT